LFSLHFCFFNHRWKVSVLIRNFKLDVCAGGLLRARSRRLCRRLRRGGHLLRRLRSRSFRRRSSCTFFSLFERRLRRRLFSRLRRLHSGGAFFSFLESSRGRCYACATKRGSRPLLVLKRRRNALAPVCVCLFILARVIRVVSSRFIIIVVVDVKSSYSSRVQEHALTRKKKISTRGDEMTYEILQQNRNEAKKTLLPYSRKIDEDERMNESEQSLRSKKKKKKKKKKRTRTRRGRETFSIAFSFFSLLTPKSGETDVDEMENPKKSHRHLDTSPPREQEKDRQQQQQQQQSSDSQQRQKQQQKQREKARLKRERV